MSLFKRLFSVDYRAALSAEASGNLEQAAEHYVLAGEPAEAARIHLLRAARAGSRTDRIAALRDALHWSDDDPMHAPRICKRLGKDLLEQAQSEGVATERDRQRVREAAELLVRGRDYETAGSAFESIGDTGRAARIYSRGGLVDRMEAVLAQDEARLAKERILRDSFANYEMHMSMGERDQAREDLRACLGAADNKSEYRRLLDELESHLITGGLVVLRKRHDPAIAVFAGSTVVLGRDNLCELPLRDSGISRRHAEISVGAPDTRPRFMLRDAGSKNGTTMGGTGGLPVTGAVPLADRGSFALGDHCAIEYQAAGRPEHLVLRISAGLDPGRALVAAGPNEPVALEPVAGLPVCLQFQGGRPFLEPDRDGVHIELNRTPIARGRVQLIHGDQLLVNGAEVEVL